VVSPRVDSSRITEEALKLLREGGLDGVSLRRIASALGVGASTLYWHIRDKDALLAELSQRIFRDCLEAVDEQDCWQDWLRAFGMALWRAQVDIPDIRKLIVLVRLDPDQQRATTSKIVHRLTRLGMEEQAAVTAQRSVQALVTGWTTLAGDSVATTSEDRASFDRALDALIRGWDRSRRGQDHIAQTDSRDTA
jgi:TetR/AcrR family tetracycline transcriptional repressor